MSAEASSGKYDVRTSLASRIQGHRRSRIAVADGARPSTRVPRLGSLVGFAAPPEEFDVSPGVTGAWGDPVEGAVAMLIVVPSHEAVHPGLGIRDAGERLLGVAHAGLHRAEERLDEGIVVAHPRPAEGARHTETVERRLEGGALHRRAIVGVEGGLPRRDALASHDGREEPGGEFVTLGLVHLR